MLESSALNHGSDFVTDNIDPTVEGPFTMINKVEQSGAQAIMMKFGKKVDGKAHVQAKVLAKKDASGNTGEVPAQDIQNDSEYLAQVGIGSPAQTLKLDFDTGSADLWVFSEELSSSVQTQAKASGHAIFNSSGSSTWKESPGQSWQIQHGDGSTASGNVGTDTLTVGGLTIQNQAIETAKQLSSQFQKGAGDGLLGLAFGSINTVQPVAVKTPVENMIS